MENINKDKAVEPFVHFYTNLNPTTTNPNEKEVTIIEVDSTGIGIINIGKWKHNKWNQERKGFIYICNS